MGQGILLLNSIPPRTRFWFFLKTWTHPIPDFYTPIPILIGAGQGGWPEKPVKLPFLNRRTYTKEGLERHLIEKVASSIFFVCLRYNHFWNGWRLFMFLRYWCAHRQWLYFGLDLIFFFWQKVHIWMVCLGICVFFMWGECKTLGLIFCFQFCIMWISHNVVVIYYFLFIIVSRILVVKQ